MITEENIGLIIQIFTLLGIVFGVFLYFRKPQEDIENKTDNLSQQFKWERELSEKRFMDLGKRLDEAFLLASNHTNTVDVKTDKLIQTVNLLNSEIIRLSTIIEERIPKKTT